MSEKQRPKIVCLCGSTKFWQAFRDEGLRLTLEGVIVLSIGIAAPDSMTFSHVDDEEGREIKRRLDELHKRKIDLADEIFVLNVGGYVGDSTAGEMAYAAFHGKEIRFLEPDNSDAATHKAGQALARMNEDADELAQAEERQTIARLQRNADAR